MCASLLCVITKKPVQFMHGNTRDLSCCYNSMKARRKVLLDSEKARTVMADCIAFAFKKWRQTGGQIDRPWPME